MSAPIKLAFNAVPLLSHLTGIGQYVRALGEELLKSEELDVSFFYGVGWDRGLRDKVLPPVANNFKLVVRKHLPYSYELNRWAQQKVFSRGVRGVKPTLYHEPSFLSYRFEGSTVLSVHDLSWIRYPETHPAERVRAMHKFFEPSLGRADLVITDSDYVRGELIEVFGVEAAKVQTIHLAADDVFQRMSSEETRPVLQGMSLTHGQYWLAVGTLEPRKNLGLLLEAFSRLPASLRKRCPLVIAGMKGWGEEGWMRALPSMVQSGDVIYNGYLPRKEQAALVAGAKALVYPSLYEGFGLPLVEAMQCGVPVIASNASCLPEVLGGAGVLVDPNDPGSLKDRLLELMDDKDLATRLGEKSLKRSQDFSWKKCAQETLSVYKRALT